MAFKSLGVDAQATAIEAQYLRQRPAFVREQEESARERVAAEFFSYKRCQSFPMLTQIHGLTVGVDFNAAQWANPGALRRRRGTGLQLWPRSAVGA